LSFPINITVVLISLLTSLLPTCLNDRQRRVARFSCALK